MRTRSSGDSSPQEEPVSLPYSMKANCDQPAAMCTCCAACFVDVVLLLCGLFLVDQNFWRSSYLPFTVRDDVLRPARRSFLAAILMHFFTSYYILYRTYSLYVFSKMGTTVASPPNRRRKLESNSDDQDADAESWREPYRTGPTPLGHFKMLPYEIKRCIYDLCIDLGTAALFNASKELHDDSLPFRSPGDFVLEFHVDPRAAGAIMDFVRKSRRQLIQRRKIIGIDSSHENYALLDHVPVDELHEIRIHIDASDPTDPGQFVRCWYQLRRVLAILLPRWRDPDSFPEDEEMDITKPERRQSTGLPPLVVKFQNTCHARWFGAWDGSRKWTQSLPCWTTIVLGRANISCWHDYCTDFNNIFALLKRLRNARSLKIEIPGQKLIDSDPVLESMRRVAVNTTPFGLIQNNKLPIGRYTWKLGDYGSLLRENALYIWLDNMLDSFPGPTAKHLCDARSQNWCLGYEAVLRRSALGYKLIGTAGRVRFCGGGLEVLNKTDHFRIRYQGGLRRRFRQWASEHAACLCTYEAYLESHAALLEDMENSASSKHTKCLEDDVKGEEAPALAWCVSRCARRPSKACMRTFVDSFAHNIRDLPHQSSPFSSGQGWGVVNGVLRTRQPGRSFHRNLLYLYCNLSGFFL